MTQASSCTGNGNSLANAVFQLPKSFVDCHTLSLFNWDPARLIYMFETYRAKNKGTREFGARKGSTLGTIKNMI